MRSILASFAVLAAPQAHALKIELDYSYDTNGFFNQPGSRAALRAVADYFESIIHDSLARIDASEWPAGNTWQAKFYHPAHPGSTIASIPNLVVPADTLIIFAGGAPLGDSIGIGGPGSRSASGNTQAWFNLLASRGQTGALASPPTDFGPWGGSVSFNTSISWNFSTSAPAGGLTNFVPVALHEIAHLLGVGTCNSWLSKITAGHFTGAHSIASFGAPVPMETDGGHWRDDGNCTFPSGHQPSHLGNVLSRTFGSFGTPHGSHQIALMDPVTCSVGTFHKVLTDLDLAGLRDIGWQIAPPPALMTQNLRPHAGPAAFSWPSISGLTYRLERSTTLSPGSWDTLHLASGDGSILEFADPLPPPGNAYYRLNTMPLLQAARQAEPAPAEVPPAPASEHFPRLRSCRSIHATCCDG